MFRVPYAMNRGFSFLEVIIAFAVLGTGVVGSLTLINRTISLGAVLRSQLIAAHLAQEGAEVVHNIRNTNWVERDPWSTGLDNGGCNPGPPPTCVTPIQGIVNFNSTTFVATGFPDDWRLIWNSGTSRYVHNIAGQFFSRRIEISYENDENGTPPDPSDDQPVMVVQSIVDWPSGRISAVDRLYDWK